MNLFASFRIAPFFLLLITSVFIKPHSAGAALNPIDSLQQALVTHPEEDTIRVKMLLELAGAWYPMNRDSMRYYNDLAYNLSTWLGFQHGLMKTLNGKALLLWMNQQYDSALILYRKSIQVSEKINDVKFSSGIYNNIGLVFQSMGILDSAEHYHNLTLSMAQSIGDMNRMAKAYSDLSTIAGVKGDFATAVKYLLEIKQYYEEQNLLFPLMNTYVKLGNQYSHLKSFQKSKQAYQEAKRINDSLQDTRTAIQIAHNLGYIYLENKRGYDSAMFYLLEAKRMAEKFNAMDILITTEVNLGILYFETNHPEEAEARFLSVLKSPIIERMNFEKTAILVNLAMIYLSRGELEKANRYATEGLKLSELNSFTEFTMNAYGTLASIKEQQGDFEQAMVFSNQARILSDSLWNQEIADRVMSLEFQHELDKKEAENQLLIKENEVKQGVILRQWIIIAGGGIILVLLVLLTMVVIRSRNKLSALNHLLDENNRQLTEANQTKDRFFSIVAHDLRSPFNALSGLLAELDEHYTDYNETAKKQIITSLRKSTQNTFNLLNNLLDWAQSQRDRLANNPQSIDLLSLTEEVFALLKTRAELKSLNLAHTIDPSLRMVADPHLLKSILINLINNAIKFTPRNGRIDVNATIENQRVQICIHDTGIGIPKDQLDHLFRIDTSFQRTGTENEAGTGLGLVMCKEYLDIMGGRITVASEEKTGSTFCVSLPISE